MHDTKTKNKKNHELHNDIENESISKMHCHTPARDPNEQINIQNDTNDDETNFIYLKKCQLHTL